MLRPVTMRKRPISRRKGAAPPAEDDKALWDAFAKNIDPLDLKGRVPDTDSEILAEVYLELVGGRQPDFGLSVAAGHTEKSASATVRVGMTGGSRVSAPMCSASVSRPAAASSTTCRPSRTTSR